MPWLGLFDEERYNEIVAGKRVPRWPAPDTARVDARFRMAIGLGAPDARPVRYFFKIAPYFPIEEWFWGWIDVSIITIDHFQGDTGLSLEGRRFTLDIIQNYDPNLPLTDPNQWVDFKWTYHRDGFDDVWFNYRWLTSTAPFSLISIMANHEGEFGENWEFSTDLDTVPDPDWTDPFPQRSQFWNPISECYDVAPEPPPPGYAEGNGVDAYIDLDINTGNIVNRWEWSGEFFFRTFTSGFILVHSGQSANISGISSTHAYFRTISVPHGGAIPLNEWVHISVERSWQSAVGALMKVFLNGSEVGSRVQGNPATSFDRLIGNRPVGTPTFGNFDVKNFQLLTGTPESPNVIIQMPLTFNACDEGPVGNDGTTFGMDLASCP